ncbi:MAG: hypothetical protein WAW72_01905, partial [Trichococcus flocculiformis]
IPCFQRVAASESAIAKGMPNGLERVALKRVGANGEPGPLTDRHICWYVNEWAIIIVNLGGIAGECKLLSL